MNDDTIQDLKQFIEATFSQKTSGISNDVAGLSNEVSGIRKDLDNLDKKHSDKIDELSASVAEAIENTNEVTDTQLNNHEQRITRLEQKAA